MDLDRLYLPHWQFSERHQRLIDAVEDLLRFDDPLVCALLALLEAPALPCCTRKPGCSAPIAPAACASPPTGWRSARSAG
ncbi:TPA: hypothetical protein ACG5BG_004522 [Pseudomonas aeruginosa]|uniref:hypothetical protein n=1 Tax=Pseudomonas aeruginosa TaxID=287 RepID=UPI000AD08565|nr:hypothetical protein [Pseudomonas aeruginosa]EKX6241525.1 hypothetical protein [Pseudomonas aeruginosa]ELK4905279.1 hypothetical protein [Pseudomonas aeruginosa]MBG6612018.1 hypothetical protein [Pseudomonas aeruginosa]HBN9628673.1 hypothetical protein [Pseudomonas aeruginosa]HBO5289098.1 hypothetical protein [Pseudomonas aeruginosa]